MIAALLATSVLTLLVAALTLLPPLEHRLRQEDLDFLTQATVGLAPALRRLETPELRPGSPVLGRLARMLERRTGARVFIFDGRGRRLADSDPDSGPQDIRGGPFDDVSRVLVSGKRIRGVRTVGGVGVGRVANPVSSGGRHLVVAMRRSLEEEHSAATVVNRAFLVAALVGLGTAIVLGIALATGLLRRLRRLQDAARKLTVEGLHADVPSDDSRDEVGELSRTFATMQTRLRQQEGVRRAFVATASHELRTPLASLEGLLEVLGEDLETHPPDLEDARKRLVAARSQSHRMSALANDLLELTRLDTELSLRRELTDLGELCRAVLAEFELRAAGRDSSLVLGLGARSPWVYGDPDGIARIVRILVDNALRVAPARQPVTVAVSEDKEFGRIEVSDFGPGVRPEERALIFERFKRGSATGDEAGFGLGLAIGRELAERMDGELRLEDREVGACFAALIPLAPHPDEPPRPNQIPT